MSEAGRQDGAVEASEEEAGAHDVTPDSGSALAADADVGRSEPPPHSGEVPATSSGVAVELFGATDVGQLREHNEDNFLIADMSSRQRGVDGRGRRFELGGGGVLMAVCDGMGGAAAGEVASQLATDIIYEHMVAAAGHNNRDQLALDIVEGLERAGMRILDESNNNRAFRGMGTTATVAALVDDFLLLGQVGDSRGYILRQTRLVQVTRDQSLVNQLIEAGQLTEEEAEHFEHSNIILQALGTAEVVQVDLTYVELRRGDVLMLCSDGLSGMIRDPEIQETLEHTDDPVEACRLLIDDANMAGGHDNISVIVAVFDGESLRDPSEADVANLRYQKYALPGWDAAAFGDTARERAYDPYGGYDDTPIIEVTGEFEVGPDVDWDDVLAGKYELQPRQEPASSNLLMWVALIGLVLAIYLLLH